MGKQELLKSVFQSFIRPGTIWWLPVSYIVDYPPKIMFHDERNKEHYIQEDITYWRNESDLSYKSDLGPTQVAIDVEIRPFLVIQKPDSLKLMKDLGVPNWYRNAVAGFPISSLNNLLENKDANRNFHVDLDRLKNRNDYEFLHYLPADAKTQLNRESYVALAAIATLNIEYFTDKRGVIEDKDYSVITGKIRGYFAL